MPHVSPLTDAQLNAIRTHRFRASQFMLVWDNEIVFQAQINQATFAASFATITFNNVVIGAYTDIKADYTVYISEVAGDLLNPRQVFRARADNSGMVATLDTLNINETSAALQDDWYIMVVKDVRLTAKLPRTIQADDPADYTYPRDYSIEPRRLLPAITGLQNCYVKALNSAGVADFRWSPTQFLADADSTSVASWSWDIDGGIFQTGSSSTQTITARYTMPGQYMPRVTIIDNLGNSNYFTFKVFVVPADYSSVINLSFDAASIMADTTNGRNVTINANATNNRRLTTRIDRIPDQTFCALWYPGDNPVITSDIFFTGRLVRETIENDYDATGNVILTTQFEIDGLFNQMQRVISRRIPIREKDTPATYGDIKNLTPWRAAHYYIAEHSTLANIASVKYGNVTENYRYPRFGSGDSDARATIEDILFTINAAMNIAPTDEIEIERIAWYLDDSDRDNLDVVADFSYETDMAIMQSGGRLYDISRAHVPVIGREMAGGGVYNTITKDVQILRALTPAVAQSDGNELVTLNRQVLKTNSTNQAASLELGQRTADDTEARQPQVILNVSHPASYAQAIAPHSAKWYTWTIPATSNNRGVGYTANERWTCRSANLVYNAIAGTFVLEAQYQLETQGVDFQTLVTTPLAGEVRYFTPVAPVAPAYLEYPEEQGSNYADPDNPPEEEPFTEDDVAPAIVPIDPSVTAALVADGRTAMVWDASTVWKVTDIPSNSPKWTDRTPQDLDPGDAVKHCAFDRFSNGAWALTEKGATQSEIWRTKAFGDLRWVASDFGISGEYEIVRGGSIKDELYIYGYDVNPATTYDFAESDRAWKRWLTTQNASGEAVIGAGAFYQAGTGWNYEDLLIEGTKRRGVTIEFGLGTDYDGATITKIEITFDFTRGNYDDGNNTAWNIGHDSTKLASTAFNATSQGEDLTYTWTGTANDVNWVAISLRAHNSSSIDYAGNALIKSILVEGVINARANRATTAGRSWGWGYDVGASPAGQGGFSVSKKGNIALAAQDGKVRKSVDAAAYEDETNGTTVGTYPKSIHALDDDGTTPKYLLAPAAAIVAKTLFLVDGSQQDITPNDGSGNGIAVSPHAITGDAIVIAGLFDFAGTVKLAFSGDGGNNWSFNTQVSNSANYLYLRNQSGSYYFYITDAGTLWYGVWDGITPSITLIAKPSPSGALLGVETR